MGNCKDQSDQKARWRQYGQSRIACGGSIHSWNHLCESAPMLVRSHTDTSCKALFERKQKEAGAATV